MDKRAFFVQRKENAVVVISLRDIKVVVRKTLIQVFKEDRTPMKITSPPSFLRKGGFV
jgi:hypothetical protein